MGDSWCRWRRGCQRGALGLEAPTDPPLAHREPAAPGAAPSLKLRLLAGSLAVALLAAGGALEVWRHTATEALLGSQQAQQLDEVRGIALLLSRQSAEIQRHLRQNATALEPHLGGDAATLQARLQEQLHRSGAHALFVTDRQGEMRAYADEESPPPGRVNLADRGYFDRTVREGQPTVSGVLASRVDGRPVVVFTHPLVQQGEVRGVFAATVRTSRHALLSGLTELGDADSTALRVVTDRDGHILAHPQRERLLQSLRTEPALSTAWQAWQDAGQPLEPAGLSWRPPGQLVTMAAAGGADWLVWQAADTGRLLAPVRLAGERAWLFLGLLVLGLTPLLMGLLRWQLRPLERLERQARQLAQPGAPDPQDAAGADTDEIGRIAEALAQAGRARHQADQTRQSALARLTAVVDAAPVGLACTRQRVFERVSPELCRLLGRRESDLIGQLTQVVFASDEDYFALSAQAVAAFKAGQTYSGQWEMLHGSGHRLWVQLRGRSLDPDDPAAGAVWSLTDVTEEVRARDHLEWSAHHDALTGLGNRKAFELRASRVVAARPRSVPASIVMIDLDRFKPVNDRWGHAAGDEMLQAVAAAIVGCVRANDLVVRYGGDEFAVLLERCPPAVALRVATAIREAVAAVRRPRGGEVMQVGASVGVAPLDQDLPDLAAWVAAADAACYAHKADGRGRPPAPEGDADPAPAPRRHPLSAP